MNLSYFKTNGYAGFDSSLEISLFEYGFIFSRTDPLSEGDLRIWFKIVGNTFDWADFKQDLDFWKEFSWANKNNLLRFLGMDEESFNNDTLESKIYSLVNYYGYENVYGTGYNPTVIRE